MIGFFTYVRTWPTEGLGLLVLCMAFGCLCGAEVSSSVGCTLAARENRSSACSLCGRPTGRPLSSINFYIVFISFVCVLCVCVCSLCVCVLSD